MAFCPEHRKWDQNPKFTPLSKTTNIPSPFICGVPSPVIFAHNYLSQVSWFSIAMRKVFLYFRVYSFATVRVIRCICALRIIAFLSLNRITMHSQQSANVTTVGVSYKYTAVSRKVVGKSARVNPERYCGWFWVHCSSKKFEKMAREAMDLCLKVLKKSNKTKFDSYSVRNSVLFISHITFQDCRVHIFLRQPFSK